jgi:hypothetical protein
MKDDGNLIFVDRPSSTTNPSVPGTIGGGWRAKWGNKGGVDEMKRGKIRRISTGVVKNEATKANLDHYDTI